MGKSLSDYPVQYIKGVGPRRASLMGRVGIKTLLDAIYYLPCRYEDRRNIRKIGSLQPGRIETVTGKVMASEVKRLPKRNFKIFELTVSDGTGIIKAKWFNQPFMKKNFETGQDIILNGVVKDNRYSGFEIDNPEYESVSDDTESFIHTSRIVPIYRTTGGLSVRQMRSIMFTVLNTSLEDLQDCIPEEILKRTSLPGLRESILNSHFPEEDTDINTLNNRTSIYQKRLSFDELFMLELGLLKIKKNKKIDKGIAFKPEGALPEKLLALLPFNLTFSQRKVFREISDDMAAPYPMNRLLQGDVGCGKTIVALMAILVAVECGYQAALMAPTEILAEQHFINIHKLIEQLGLRICLLSGSKRERPMEEIASGGINIVVGTHALIQEGVIFKELGLIVIDEQHRFGVMQRASLRRKAHNPDVLVMTATPIPRTLALTLYGDLDYSVIDEMPPGRKPVITRAFNPAQKDYIYETIKKEVGKGRQVYIVYPVIEESEKTNLKSAIIGHEALKKIFPEFKIELIHGRMKPVERENIMSLFKNGGINILVSTTVIEVGVDVPDAGMMLIVHAERFGLSQLHQLRGRVGRGSGQAYCLLLAYPPVSDVAKRRLSTMEKTNDGFRISEEDLDIRGPGEFFGTRQSGVPDLKIADLIRDIKLVETARREASGLIESDAELSRFPPLRKSLEKFWAGKIELFKTS